jgi:putative peptide zinc metalloprotease protein
VAFVGTQVSLWEAIAGRAPGQPIGHADPGLWQAVAERLNPARARPQLRKGIEHRTLATARGDTYVMLRSPDQLSPCYVRLTVEEWRLAQRFTGEHTVARLIAEFARISGRLAPEQVTRVVADLAANRMLGELPVDAFKPLERLHRKPWPVRLVGGLVSALRGRRVVLAGIDPLISGLYQAGGRVLFTRVAAVVMAATAALGLGLFVWSWYRADQSVFLTGSSYLTGALVLLVLNFVALLCHELGHALAVKHAGRRVPVAGFLIYFGIPSVFVDTSDVWMAGRKARLLTTAAGPISGLVLAGVAQLVGVLFPPLAPWAFKLSFAWYINVLFNLNPFLALERCTACSPCCGRSSRSTSRTGSTPTGCPVWCSGCGGPDSPGACCCSPCSAGSARRCSTCSSAGLGARQRRSTSGSVSGRPSRTCRAS